MEEGKGRLLTHATVGIMEPPTWWEENSRAQFWYIHFEIPATQLEISDRVVSR